MKMTPEQVSKFWRDWSQVCRQENWSKTESEIQRKTMLAECGFSSLTLVDKTAGCDRVFAEIGKRLGDLGKTMETDNQEAGLRRRILWKITSLGDHLGGPAYVQSIIRDRFKVTPGLGSFCDLSTPMLTELLMTLQARLKSREKKVRENFESV